MSHYTGSVPNTTVVEDWRASGDCRQYEPDLFFSGHSVDIRTAKDICARCPVTSRCLQWALDTGEEWGVWGGLSERQRRAIRRRKAAKLPAAVEDVEEKLPPATLKEAWEARIQEVDGGHLTWSGRDSLYFRGVSFTPRRAAFTVSRRRKPIGQVEVHCGVDGCVQPKHLTDVKERAELSAAGTPVRSPRYAPCGTRSAYQRHKKNGEPIDAACQAEYNASQTRYALTGSTKAAA